MELIFGPWPWYLSGFLIACTMFVLLLIGKKFGMSSNLRTICSACGAGKVSDFFQFNWKEDRWNLMVLFGAMLGGYVASKHMTNYDMPELNEKTLKSLDDLNIAANNHYLPDELFSMTAMSDPKSLALLILGGILIGFGARYAGGCTSGHAISGLSNLQLPSLIAVIGFFIGGLIMVHLLFPILF